MKKIMANEDFKKVLSRPEKIDLREREILIAYRVIEREMAEELETMTAQEALKLFKDVLLRVV
jgi:hypothetical protein